MLSFLFPTFNALQDTNDSTTLTLLVFVQDISFIFMLFYPFSHERIDKDISKSLSCPGEE